MVEFSFEYLQSASSRASPPSQRKGKRKLAAVKKKKKKKIRLDLIARIESLAIFDVVTRPTVNYRREVTTLHKWKFLAHFQTIQPFNYVSLITFTIRVIPVD